MVVYNPVSIRETAIAIETRGGRSPKPSQSRLVKSNNKKPPMSDVGTETRAEIVTRSAASASLRADTIAIEKPKVVPVVANPTKAKYSARSPMSAGV
jgi:hypothetical protein